jgi:hypothetical protein
MLALIYLALAIYLGDLLLGLAVVPRLLGEGGCRRFYRFACLAVASQRRVSNSVPLGSRRAQDILGNP